MNLRNVIEVLYMAILATIAVKLADLSDKIDKKVKRWLGNNEEIMEILTESDNSDPDDIVNFDWHQF